MAIQIRVYRRLIVLVPLIKSKTEEFRRWHIGNMTRIMFRAARVLLSGALAPESQVFCLTRCNRNAVPRLVTAHLPTLPAPHVSPRTSMLGLLGDLSDHALHLSDIDVVGFRTITRKERPLLKNHHQITQSGYQGYIVTSFYIATMAPRRRDLDLSPVPLI